MKKNSLPLSKGQRLFDLRLPPGCAATLLPDGMIWLVRKKAYDKVGWSIVVALSLFAGGVFNLHPHAPDLIDALIDPLVFAASLAILFIPPALWFTLEGETWYIRHRYVQVEHSIAGIKRRREYWGTHLYIDAHLNDNGVSCLDLQICYEKQCHTIVYDKRKVITGLGAFLEEYTGWPLTFSETFVKYSYTEFLHHPPSPLTQTAHGQKVTACSHTPVE